MTVVEGCGELAGHAITAPIAPKLHQLHPLKSPIPLHFHRFREHLHDQQHLPKGGCCFSIEHKNAAAESYGSEQRWWRETDFSLYRCAFLSPLNTKSVRRVLVRGYGGYLLIAGFSENFRERSERNFLKKLVAKGKSPMKKRLVINLPSYIGRRKNVTSQSV